MNGNRSDSATIAAAQPARSHAALDWDNRSLGVREAQAVTAIDQVIEVYVGWAFDPLNIVSRYRDSGASWTTVSARLRNRVIAAIKPLTDAGWRMDGSPVGTMRWDTSQESTGQHYDGCWVRMRTRGA